MNWAPHTTVAAVVEQDGRFLLVEEKTRSSELLVLNQPAGHLEDQETLLEALVREVSEETAWQVEPLHLVGIYKWRIPRTGSTYLRFCIAAAPLAHLGDQQLDPEIFDTHWLTPDEIVSQQARHRSPMVMHCLNDYLAGKRYPLELMNELAS